ncbi:MAG: hypothetical protein Q9217_005909 [Psora testacea]
MQEVGQPGPTPTKRWLPLTTPPMNPSSAAIQSSQSNGVSRCLPIHTTVTQPSAPDANLSVCSGMVWTPPATPDKADTERKRSSISIDSEKLVSQPTEELKNMLSIGVGLGANPREMVMHMVENGMDVGPLAQVPETARPYKKSYQVQGELGHGAWSIVYSASQVSAGPSTPLPPSPPSSPGRSRVGSRTDLLAVKALARRDGRKVLEREARILTYLHSHGKARNYLVPFHGFDDARCSIILDAIPLLLQNHVKNAGKTPVSTRTMFDPIIGAPQWADLATCLISGLAFLQSKHCVHGDIKPANILLRSGGTEGKLTPLYCDFSSSHVRSTDAPATPIEEVNAVTTDYTSPELLESFYHRNGERAVATFASDIFALGVTLIFAATGESPYAGAQIELQKVGMAREGLPLEFVRNGAQAARVMKRKAVDVALMGAVEADVGKRVEVKKWESLVRDVAARWRDGGWVNGG